MYNVQLWDLRQEAAVFEFDEEHDDCVSVSFMPDTHQLLAVGGRYLSVLDYKKGTLVARSDEMEEPLTCAAMVKVRLGGVVLRRLCAQLVVGALAQNGTRCVVGSEDGVLNIWHAGDWGAIKSRATTLCKQSVDDMLTVDDDRIITAGGDGVRCVPK